MTRTFQKGMQSWALFRGPEISSKGFHEPEPLTVELKESSPAPVSQPPL
jgi:hypothetical protein